jgi:hypothetical protein
LVADDKRGRILLFGGGSGSDLLRSGQDYADVWQLHLQTQSSPHSPNSNSKGTSAASTATAGGTSSTHDDDFLSSTTPWKWSRVHFFPAITTETNDDDSTVRQANNEATDTANAAAAAAAAATTTTSGNTLTPTERLNLGRCHACHKLSDDTCLLVFGSGRPSTNAILGYRLDRDEFFRPTVTGPLPQARFTFASVFIQELGYLLVHGGYCSQSSESISDTCVLDCCPALRRRHPFDWWPVHTHAQSYPAVNVDDEEATGPTMSFETIVRTLHVTPIHRQSAVAQMLLHTHVFRERNALSLLTHVASGRVTVRRNGDGSEDEEEEDDESSNNGMQMREESDDDTSTGIF